MLFSCRMDLLLSLKEKMDLQKVGEAVDGVWLLLLVWDLGLCLCWRVDEVKKYCHLNSDI